MSFQKNSEQLILLVSKFYNSCLKLDMKGKKNKDFMLGLEYGKNW